MDKQRVEDGAAPPQLDDNDASAEVEAFLAKQASAERRRKPIMIALVVLVAAAVIAVVVIFVRGQAELDADEAKKAAAAHKRASYGRHAEKIAELRDLVAGAPCAKSKRVIVMLAERLNVARAHRDALEAAAAYFKRCGEYRRLRWATYTAYKRLGELDQAIAEASKLVAAVPRDRDYRWWRGVMYERKGDLVRAAADYRQAIAIAPYLTRIPFNLASVLERRNKPCEALFWLHNFLRQGRRHKREPSARLSERIGKLAALRACQDQRGRGDTDISLPEHADAKTAAAVSVNGKLIDTPFEVRPGIVYSMLSSKTAQAAGITAAASGAGVELIVGGPDGYLKGRLIKVARISIGGAEARDVDVVVVAALPREAPGVIAQSFLARFTVSMDRPTAAMRLVGRAR